MGGRCVTNHAVIGNKEDLATEITLHCDKDIVPVHANCLSRKRFRCRDFFSALSGCALHDHSAKQAIALYPRKPVPVPDKLEGRFFRISFFFEEFVGRAGFCKIIC